MMQRNTVISVGATALAFLLTQASWTQSITWLRTLGGASSSAFGVSDDGKTVVGIHGGRPAIWLLPQNSLGTCDSCSGGWLSDVSENGDLAVGTTANFPYSRPLIWTPTEGFQNIEPTNATSWLYFITPSGSFASGYYYPYMARWDLGNRTFTITDVPGYANGMSDDGRYLCGANTGFGVDRGALVEFDNSGRQIRAVVLEPALGNSSSAARDIESDGSVVIGYSWQNSNPSLLVPTIWRSANNWQPETLPHLGGGAFPHRLRGGIGYGSSKQADGTERAVRWRINSQEVDDLNTIYSELLRDGSVLAKANGVSRNGRFIVGQGYNAATGRNEAFIIDTQCSALYADVNGDGTVDDADLLQVLFSFGSSCRN